MLELPYCAALRGEAASLGTDLRFTACTQKAARSDGCWLKFSVMHGLRPDSFVKEAVEYE